MTDNPRWLDAEAAARYIGVGKMWFLRLVSSRVIPQPSEHEGRPLWDASAIDAVFMEAPASRPDREPFTDPLLDPGEIVKRSQSWSGIRCGIYFLILRGTIVYVGQAVDVMARLSQHAKEKTFDSWHWIACERSQMDAAEAAYIRAFKPALNKTLVGGRS